MLQSSRLTTRQHEREAVYVDVEFSIAPAHATQVNFSSTSSAMNEHVVRGCAIDISAGGMALLVNSFIPRMCEGTVRVLNPIASGTGRDGSPIHDVIFEHEVKVRRVAMTGHMPQYELGTAFVDPEATIDQRIHTLREQLDAARSQLGRAGGNDARP